MHILDPFGFASLLIAYKRQELSEKERIEVEAVLKEHPELYKISDELNDKERVSRELAVFESFDPEKAYRRIIRARRRPVARWFYPAVAAIVILAVSFSLYLAFPKTERLTYYVKPSGQLANSVILRLTDGCQVAMDTLRSYQKNHQVALKNTDGQLWVYKALATAEDQPLSRLNQLTVPYKKTYRVVLDDGTRVSLNAGSTLDFPSDLSQNDRVVMLQGEAHFEVSHRNNQKFIVLMPDVAVEVLGTVFNVKAYADEAKTIITLLSGQVAVTTQSGQFRRMAPGEQVLYDQSTKKMTVQLVDAPLFTAWADGKFLFKNTPLDDILRRIGRWYGLDIVYKDVSIKEIQYSGKMKMYDSVQEVLRKFEESGGLHFQLDETSITVSKI
jgi:transmembrane sensor